MINIRRVWSWPLVPSCRAKALYLGLTLGLDDPDSEDAIDQADGTIEYVAGTTGAPGAGQMIVDAAPQHDGLEGNLLTTLAFALDINSVVGGTLSVSVLVDIASSLM